MPTPQSVNLQNKLATIRREAEERDAKRSAEELKLRYVDLNKTPVSIEALKQISESDSRAGKLACIQIKFQDIAVAVVDPRDPAAVKVLDALKEKNLTVKVFIASLSGITQTWNMYQFVPPPTEKITGNMSIEKEKLAELMERYKIFAELVKEMAGTDFLHITTTDLFSMILAGALSTRASDIHFEAQEKDAKVRYRIDGILHDVVSLPPRSYGNLVTRVKLLSELKINVREEAQDGRFTIKLPEKEVEMRVSIIPSEFGETIVMRVLDPGAISVGLEALGLRADDMAMLQTELDRPNGLILNTGPTGSGKTTTLYSCLRYVASPEIKVITVEDPIEYRVPGIEQTQIDNEAGYTFASGLRSILRQDPDVILVGEIRDGETADIALQAALTGHLVFSTLHTNDAIGAVPRLVDLGVKPATIGPALTLMIAQRLVRKLCEKCKKAVKPDAALIEKIKSFLAKLPARVDRAPFENFIKGESGVTLYEPVGCEVCNGFGYKGRIGIFEFLRSTSELQEAILESASQGTLKKLAEKQEMIRIQEDGILKILHGITTIKEVEGATGPIEWG